jgi:hypothetical protein
MARKPNLTLKLSDREKRSLRWLAKTCGWIIGRGDMATEGSISKLLISLVEGDAGYFLLQPKDLDPKVKGRLKEISRQNPDMAYLLLRVNAALTFARIMKDIQGEGDYQLLGTMAERRVGDFYSIERHRLETIARFVNIMMPDADTSIDIVFDVIDHGYHEGAPGHQAWVDNGSTEEIASWVYGVLLHKAAEKEQA